MNDHEKLDAMYERIAKTYEELEVALKRLPLYGSTSDSITLAKHNVENAYKDFMHAVDTYHKYIGLVN
jgi:hypothetical protein